MILRVNPNRGYRNRNLVFTQKKLNSKRQKKIDTVKKNIRGKNIVLIINQTIIDEINPLSYKPC